MKKFLLGLLFGLAAYGQANAQTMSAIVVAACGTAPVTYTAGQPFPLTVDTNGNLCFGSSGGGGVVTALSSPINPTSVLTRPANTTAYAATQLIASSTTAGSIVVPSVTIPNGKVIVPRVRLKTSATTGWGTTLTLTLFNAAPTYTNGDGGTYAVATGGGGRLAQFSCGLTQYGDAASGECSLTVGNAMALSQAGTAVYWDLQTTAAATPISGQTFTLTVEGIQ